MNHGGAQIELKEIANSLSKNKIDFKLIGGKGTLKDMGLHQDNLSLLSMSRPIKLSELLHYAKTLFATIRKEMPDLIFCSGPIACYLGLFFGFCLGIKKRVYRVSGCTITKKNNFFVNLRNWTLEKLSISFSTDAFFVTERNMRKYEKINLKAENYCSIPTIINFPEKIPEKDLDYSKLRFGFLGNLQKEKGVVTLVDAFLEIGSPISELHIAGDGNLRQLIQNKDLDHENIKYHGLVDPFKFLQKVDYLVLPTTYMEGLPQVIAQAIYCKCPIIAFDHEGIPDEVLESYNGFLISSSKNALKAKMKEVLADLSLARKMSVNCEALIEFIKSKHSNKHLYNTLLDLTNKSDK